MQNILHALCLCAMRVCQHQLRPLVQLVLDCTTAYLILFVIYVVQLPSQWEQPMVRCRA